MTLVKICGIRHEEHALAAARAGADLIGFVFVPVRREVAPARAREIITRVQREVSTPPAAIGLFVNERADVINRTVEDVGLDLVQLHGDESPDVAASVDVPVIQAIRMSSDMRVSDVQAEIEAHLAHAAGVLVDSHVPGHWGGTGVVGDWDSVSELAQAYPVVLAGGLSPENVIDAIRSVRPSIVDVSSGVETEGVKDSGKIECFIQNAQVARSQMETPVAGAPLRELIYNTRARLVRETLPTTGSGID